MSTTKLASYYTRAVFIVCHRVLGTLCQQKKHGNKYQLLLLDFYYNERTEKGIVKLPVKDKLISEAVVRRDVETPTTLAVLQKFARDNGIFFSPILLMSRQDRINVRRVVFFFVYATLPQN